MRGGFGVDVNLGVIRIAVDLVEPDVFFTVSDCRCYNDVFLFVHSLFQGPGISEEAMVTEPPHSQQPGARHSFVQEHFQAQYK